MATHTYTAPESDYVLLTTRKQHPKHHWLTPGRQCWALRIKQPPHFSTGDFFLVVSEVGVSYRAILTHDAFLEYLLPVPVLDAFGQRVRPIEPVRDALDLVVAEAVGVIATHVMENMA